MKADRETLQKFMFSNTEGIVYSANVRGKHQKVIPYFPDANCKDESGKITQVALGNDYCMVDAETEGYIIKISELSINGLRIDWIGDTLPKIDGSGIYRIKD